MKLNKDQWIRFVVAVREARGVNRDLLTCSHLATDSRSTLQFSILSVSLSAKAYCDNSSQRRQAAMRIPTPTLSIGMQLSPH